VEARGRPGGVGEFCALATLRFATRRAKLYFASQP
jgi:hypothetical protein